MQTIAIVNQKGGVGKSTTAVNLGAGLTRQGKRVLLIDADSQANLTEMLGWQQPDELSPTLATMLERIIKHGLTAEGRIASFSTVLPDQPNALATYLAALSHEGVNVLEVYHERSSMKVGVGSCRVRMVVETRNHEHIRQLYSYLAEQGYTIKE